MFTIIAIVVIAGVAYFLFKKLSPSEIDKVEAVVEKVEAKLAPVVQKAEAVVEAVETKVEAAVKKARKPRATKKTTKKTTTSKKV